MTYELSENDIAVIRKALRMLEVDDLAEAIFQGFRKPDEAPEKTQLRAALEGEAKEARELRERLLEHHAAVAR